MPALRSPAPATTVGGRHPGKPRTPATLADLGLDLAAETWQQHGHCHTTDPDAFFPDDETPHLHANRPAYRVCASCPVRTECANYARRHRLVGIWGGTSTRQRRLERRRTRTQWEEAA